MQAWIFQPVAYVPPRPFPQVWPLPGTLYDPETGEHTFQNTIEQAVVAEQLGFDGISVAEHHYSATNMTPNPMVMAGALSQRLQRIKIALLGATIPLTNPVRVAEEFAMLDNLTKGRLVAGMLRGTPNEFLTYGTNPDETRALYEEGIELVLKALTEPQPFGWQGKHYQYRTVSIWPRPIQQPHPPVFISGQSQESCRFAARLRLSIGLAFAPVPMVAQLTAFYREQAAKVGWEPTTDNLLYRGFIHVAETDEKACQEVDSHYWNVPDPDARPTQTSSPVSRSSESDEGYAAVAVAAQQDARKTTTNATLAMFGVQFCGSPNTVFEQIRRLRDEAGVGIIDFCFQGLALPHQMVLRSMELFGKEVLPRMHEL